MRSEFILIVIFSCIGGFHFQGPPTVRCREYFTAIENGCYNFSTVAKGWTEAYLICQSIGGNLATIENSEEQTRLENEIRSSPERSISRGWWVGGSDAVEEGQWQWMTNAPRYFTYTNWYGVEPDTQVDPENCLVLYQKWNYQWADRFCCDPFNYICESRPVTNNNPYTYSL